MRSDATHIEPFRFAGNPSDGFNGAWQIPHHPTGASLRVVASDGGGWDHVSVSLRNRTPNWREMEFICRRFWGEDEAVMQLHPPRSEWISNHPHCLHMWKPHNTAIPLPPSIMVGSKMLGEMDPNRAADRIRATRMLNKIGAL